MSGKAIVNSLVSVFYDIHCIKQYLIEFLYFFIFK